MPKARFVPFDSVEHQERRPGVVLHTDTRIGKRPTHRIISRLECIAVEETRHHALDKAMVQCVESFKRWCDPAPLSDDVSILALEIPPRS